MDDTFRSQSLPSKVNNYGMVFVAKYAYACYIPKGVTPVERALANQSFHEHVRVVGKEPFFSGTCKTSPLAIGHFTKITIELRFLRLNI
jgi:hypothetical protein